MISGLMFAAVLAGLVWRKFEPKLIQNIGWDYGLSFLVLGGGLSISGRLIPWGAGAAILGVMFCVIGIYTSQDWRQWHK